MKIFVTGATGFIGTALIKRLIDDESIERIYLLVRGNHHSSAAERVAELWRSILPPQQWGVAGERLVAVDGDLTKPNLGIDSADYSRLAGTINQILHIGASTDFGAPLEESRLYNVQGTERVLELADTAYHLGALKRFDYVSTAFVAGTKRGHVDEDSLERGQDFANNYERSKYEAERLVRSAAEELPTVIYRPSIVVGDSRNGYTPHFKVLYWPLRLLAKRVLPLVPCNLEAKLDVVPIDYVADAIRALMVRELAIGKTFHLTAGEDRRVPMREIFRAAVRYAGIKSVPVIPMWLFDLVRLTPLRYLIRRDYWETTELAKPYYHYLKGTGVVFDSRKTENYLRELGIAPPDWRHYHQVVLRFCHESRWGRRLAKPMHAYLEGR